METTYFAFFFFKIIYTIFKYYSRTVMTSKLNVFNKSLYGILTKLS